MPSLNKLTLPFVVFTTGAAVLVVEVVAIRILSPYFGNTLYTTSSVIGIILAALSVGYYVGGRLADRSPSLHVFYALIAVSGLSVLVIEVLSAFLLPILGYKFSIVTGPLVSATFLFFLPSFLTGMISPFAVTIQKNLSQSAGIGTVTGDIFFWSTAGSILGSILAGFVLIPHFGVHTIILMVGFLLLVLGFVGMLLTRARARIVQKILVAAIMIGGTAMAITRMNGLIYSQAFRYVHDGVYEKLTIFDGEFRGKKTRFFIQDRSSSGAMYLDSDELVYDYTKYYALYKLFNPNIKEALVIGGGAYTLPKVLLSELPGANVDVAEIEPSLFELGKEYFRVPNDPRLKNYVEDGRRFLHDTPKTYDLIFSDVYYTLISIPSHFTTEEFFKIARDTLNPDGIFMGNFIGSLSRQSPSFLFSEMKTFRAVFPNSYFLAMKSPHSTETQNFIFVGFKSDKKVDFANLAFRAGIDPILAGAKEKLVDPERFELSPYPMLTDDYAPVDYLATRMLTSASVSGINAVEHFDAEEAMQLLGQQLRYGFRYPTASGHQKTQDFLRRELEALSHHVVVQAWQHKAADGTNYHLQNVIGRFWPDKKERMVFGAHYDSKRFANRDEKNPRLPVTGADDSASGVAVLLEVARYLANVTSTPAVGVDVVFFDGEEGEENMTENQWKPLGAVYFADHLKELYPEQKPKVGVVIDMVCDRNLDIYKEESSLASARTFVDDFWNIARQVDPKVFRESAGLRIGDDHWPLQAAGIPAFVVIDLNYPYWHTSHDTIDKCSARSLDTVGNAVLKYIYLFK